MPTCPASGNKRVRLSDADGAGKDVREAEMDKKLHNEEEPSHPTLNDGTVPPPPSALQPTTSKSTAAEVPSLAALQSRLGDNASQLNLPLCAICSTQTDYTGSDLQLDSEDSDYKCPICLDPRQYIGLAGQKWTTLERLILGGHRNEFKELIPGQVWTMRTQPAVGIGQRAFLIKDEDKLIMWDCIALLDEETIVKINEISGGKGVAHMVVSHPHFYSTTTVWALAFPNMQLHLAKVDFTQWYQRKEVIECYQNATEGTSSAAIVAGQIRLKTEEQTSLERCKIFLLGGHFPGSLVLLWKDCLFIADTIQVVPSGRYHSDKPQREGVATFSFLWSYPNLIPLTANEVKNVCQPLEGVEFDKAFGGFEGYEVWAHAKEKVFQSRDIMVKRLQTGM